MFNGSIPIILDSLKQHYFIDRDGKMFRYVLNFLRMQRLTLPETFADWELLLDEARFYEIPSMIKAVEATRYSKSLGHGSSRNAPAYPASWRNRGVANIKVEDEGQDGDSCECVSVHISPELGERISLSANKPLVEEVFPELNAALADSRTSGWNLDSSYLVRFPLNGYCKLNSLQVFQRLLTHGFEVIASTGGGVEGQQFSDYLLCKRL